MGRSDKRKREAEGLSAAEVLYNLGASSCTYGGARRGTVVTVLEFVSGRYNYHDEATWRKVIEGGQLRVNSAEAEPEQALRPGDVVSIESNRADEPEVDLQYKVLAVHPSTQKSPLDFIAVEKSGNLPVSASGRYRKNTLAYELQSTLDVRCKPVHRLDKETSGCVVVAKDDTTAATLSGIFAGTAVTKQYCAVLIGAMHRVTTCADPVQPVHLTAGEEYCSGALFPMRKIRMRCDDAGKTCRTTFTPVAVAGGLTLASIVIESGRTHQIRVHAEQLGFPILGDKVYGHGNDTEAQTLRWTRNEVPMETPFGVIDRHLLHCSRMVLPIKGVEDHDEAWSVSSDPMPFFTKFPACTALFEKTADGKEYKNAPKGEKQKGQTS